VAARHVPLGRFHISFTLSGRSGTGIRCCLCVGNHRVRRHAIPPTAFKNVLIGSFAKLVSQPSWNCAACFPNLRPGQSFLDRFGMLSDRRRGQGLRPCLSACTIVRSIAIRKVPCA